MPSITKFLALFIAATSLTSGFRIPEGQPDGVYLANTKTGEIQLQQRSRNASDLANSVRRRHLLRSLLQAHTVRTDLRTVARDNA
ncbi:hypothetical protein V8F33_002980 [Rhypophila sp. PSN 637]